MNKKKLIILISIIICLVALVCVGMVAVSRSRAAKIEDKLDLGEKYLEELEYEKALAAYKEVLKIDPKSVEAYLGMAEVYIAMGEYEEALEILKEGYDETESRKLEKKIEEVEEMMSEEEETHLPEATPEPTATPIPSTQESTDDLLPEEVPEEQVVISEEEQLEIIRITSGYEIESHVYLDMDCDGDFEVIAVCFGNEGYEAWYCSSDGRVCMQAFKDPDGFDFCQLEILGLEEETHVAVNFYFPMGTWKEYTILALHNKEIKSVGEGMGYVYADFGGGARLQLEAYDAYYDPTIEALIGHTWKTSYLYYDGTYKEYELTEISEADFLAYENAAALQQSILQEDTSPNIIEHELIYYVRENGYMHIQSNYYYDDGSISYYYYTLQYSNKVIKSELGSKESGMIMQ